ncbi:MAG: FTR1 family protein [Caldilineaceae bacterium]|nr:FTR1 family protein [Caldilineaceae bacterium]
MQRIQSFALLAMILLTLFPRSGSAQSVPPWQAGEEIRAYGADIQTALFRDDPDTAALDALAAEMRDNYINSLQPQVTAAAPGIDAAILSALDEIDGAVAAGDGPALALARGRLWSELLHGSQAVTLAALDAGDGETAAHWLRLREYRRSTIVNLVESPADAVMQAVLRGSIAPEDAALVVAADLRGTTFFRLREALTELDDAAAAGFQSRTAEWAGKAQVYFATLAADFSEKQGIDAAAAVSAHLDAAGTAAVAGNWTDLAAATAAAQEALALYQPVAFSQEQLAERAQLLYLYTDLIWIEYRDAVRDGEITIDIEYQEALTFRRQAQSVFQELRPVIAAEAPRTADRLAEIYVELEEIINVIGPKTEVEALVAEADQLIVESLGVDPDGNDAGASLTVINGLLDQMAAAVAAGDYAGAETARIEAYAFFETGPEVTLANRAPRLAREIEGLFWEGTHGEAGLAALIRGRAGADEINARLETVRARLADSDEILTAEAGIGVTILSSAAIILREGLEAVLILGAIIGFLRADANSRKYIWWVAAGVVAAVGLSVLMWWASLNVLTISFSNRELLEGITALVAAGVLFYVTNWIFQKVYVQDWMSFVKEQVGKAITGGSAFGLAFLGFTVVFREGFETVLFYQTLLFDAPVQPVLVGFLIGSAAIAVVAWLILQAGKRLPLKPFFTITTILLLIMAFNFVGKGVRGLQEAGAVPATWLAWMPENLALIEIFGIYPTVETTLAQLGFVLLIALTFLWSLRRGSRAKSRTPVPAR